MSVRSNRADYVIYQFNQELSHEIREDKTTGETVAGDVLTWLSLRVAKATPLSVVVRRAWLGFNLIAHRVPGNCMNSINKRQSPRFFFFVDILYGIIFYS